MGVEVESYELLGLSLWLDILFLALLVCVCEQLSRIHAVLPPHKFCWCFRPPASAACRCAYEALHLTHLVHDYVQTSGRATSKVDVDLCSSHFALVLGDNMDNFQINWPACARASIFF